MEKEIIETYYYKPSDFNQDGRRYLDGKTFRDYIKECEIDFHNRHFTGACCSKWKAVLDTTWPRQ